VAHRSRKHFSCFMLFEVNTRTFGLEQSFDIVTASHLLSTMYVNGSDCDRIVTGSDRRTSAICSHESAFIDRYCLCYGRSDAVPAYANVNISVLGNSLKQSGSMVHLALKSTQTLSSFEESSAVSHYRSDQDGKTPVICCVGCEQS
jgi:hypothetical protein